MIYKIGVFLCRLYVLLRLRFHVEGIEHVPKDQGFVLACNHRHVLDPVLLGISLGRDIHFMAKIEIFGSAFGRWLFPKLKAIAVDRGKGDTGALDEAEQVLRHGGVLGMFPEGHRSKDGKLLRPKSGTAMLAHKTRSPILPAAVCFHGKELGWRTKVTVRYGPIIPYADLGFSENAGSTKEIKHASNKIMEHIRLLLGEYDKSEVSL